MAKCKPLVLPGFDLLKRQPELPHNASVVAEKVVPNEYGVGITYRVKQNRQGKLWTISASHEGYRSSNTLRTSKPDVAKGWICAVNSGKITVKD